MEKSSKYFLIRFYEQLRAKYPETISFGQIANENDLFNNKSDEKNQEFTLSEIKQTIEKILSIVHFFRVNVHYETIILNREKVSKITPRNLNDTVKKGNMWSLKGPNKLYSDVPETEIATYENRFITLFITELDTYLHKMEKDLLLTASFAKEEFHMNTIDPMDFQLLEEIRQREEKDDSFLSNEDLLEQQQALHFLESKLQLAKESVLFKECNKLHPLDPAIQPTNLLLKNGDYNDCYRSFLKFHKSLKQETDLEKYFFNYCALKMLSIFNQIGYHVIGNEDISFSFLQGFLLIKPFVLAKKDKMITIYSKEENLYIEVSMPTNDELSTNSKLKAIMHFQSEINSIEEVKRFVDNNSSFDQALFFTLQKKGLYKNNMVHLSLSSSEMDNLLSKVIYSLSLTQNGAFNLYNKVCPTCGALDVSEETGAYLCLNCSCKWSMLKKNDDEMIWIKRFGR